MPRVDGKAPHELLPGEYGKWNKDGHWYAVPPGTDLTANLSAHSIIEHENGAITVSPSILVGDGQASWHGYLRNGIFEEC